MNILELAKECRFTPTDRMGYYYAGIGDIEAFAAAVIEDYKASLVPVAWYCGGDAYTLKAEADDTSLELGYEIFPLYALPKETK